MHFDPMISIHLPDSIPISEYCAVCQYSAANGHTVANGAPHENGNIDIDKVEHFYLIIQFEFNGYPDAVMAVVVRCLADAQCAHTRT